MSIDRLQEHRRLWAQKPVLAAVYRRWFELLLSKAPVGGRVLEVGAGPGFLSEFARRERRDLRWVAADLLEAPWNDVAADALRLPFREGSVDAVVGLDVLHHLARPATFFTEAARVLRPNASLALVEPWITPLSYPIYRFLHQESCTLGLDPWDPFPTARSGKDTFEGDAVIPWKVWRRAMREEWGRFGLRPPVVRRLNTFAYLLSLGFRPGSLLPHSLVRPLLRLDLVTEPLGLVLATRAFLVWVKTP